MKEEKLKVLEMIQEGKITADEGMELLKAIEESNEQENGRHIYNGGEVSGVEEGVKGKYRDKFLRIRVNGDKVKKVNVNIPLPLLKYGTKLINYGMNFVPQEAKAEMEKKGIDLEALDLDEIVRLVEQDAHGKLVDIDLENEEDGKMQVEICVD